MTSRDQPRPDTTCKACPTRSRVRPVARAVASRAATDPSREIERWLVSHIISLTDVNVDFYEVVHTR